VVTLCVVFAAVWIAQKYLSKWIAMTKRLLSKLTTTARRLKKAVEEAVTIVETKPPEIAVAEDRQTATKELPEKVTVANNEPVMIEEAKQAKEEGVETAPAKFSRKAQIGDLEAANNPQRVG
jgi:hypothetical protein